MYGELLSVFERLGNVVIRASKIFDRMFKDGEVHNPNKQRRERWWEENRRFSAEVVDEAVSEIKTELQSIKHQVTNGVSSVDLSAQERASIVKFFKANNPCGLPTKMYKKVPPQVPNCVVEKSARGSGGIYHFHQDGCFTLHCKDEEKVECTANNGLLPTRNNLMVATSVYGEGACKAEISWRLEAIKLASIFTAAQADHFQFVKCNGGGIFHGSAMPTPGKGETQRSNIDLRNIDTYRMIQCPHCDREEYRRGLDRDGLTDQQMESEGMKKINNYWWIGDPRNPQQLPGRVENTIFQQCSQDESRLHLGLGDSEPANATDGDGVTVLKDMDAQKYPKSISRQTFEWLMKRSVLGKTIQGFKKQVERRYHCVEMSSNSRSLNAQHRGIIERALELGIVIDVVGESFDKKDNQPLFCNDKGKPFCHGDILPESQFPNLVNNRQKCVLDARRICPNVISAFEMYKNRIDAIHAVWRHCETYPDCDPDNLSKQDFYDNLEKWLDDLDKILEENPIVLMGFSGSTYKCDFKIPNQQKSFTNQAQYKSGGHQSIDNKNTSALFCCMENQSVFALFVPRRHWDHPLEAERKKRKISATTNKSLTAARASKHSIDLSDFEDDSEEESPLADESSVESNHSCTSQGEEKVVAPMDHPGDHQRKDDATVHSYGDWKGQDTTGFKYLGEANEDQYNPHFFENVFSDGDENDGVDHNNSDDLQEEESPLVVEVPDDSNDGKKQKICKDGYLFLGYYSVESVRGLRLDPTEEISENFLTYMEYLQQSKNKPFFNYHYNGRYEFKLKRAFGTLVIKKINEARDGEAKFESVEVFKGDTQPLSTSITEIEEVLKCEVDRTKIGDHTVVKGVQLCETPEDFRKKVASRKVLEDKTWRF